VHLNRKFAKTLLAVVVPMGMIGSVALFSGVATAKKAPVASISCTSVVGVVTFSPALQPGPTNTTGTDGKKGYTITISGETTCRVHHISDQFGDGRHWFVQAGEEQVRQHL
jgi:hypothetical protein